MIKTHSEDWHDDTACWYLRLLNQGSLSSTLTYSGDADVIQATSVREYSNIITFCKNIKKLYIWPPVVGLLDLESECTFDELSYEDTFSGKKYT